MASERWFLWKLWTAAFAVRLAGVGLGMLLFPGWLIPADTKGAYYPIAQNLAWGTDNQAGPLLGTTLPPLLPLWLALLMRATGPELPLWLPALFNAAFRAAGVVLVYLLGRRYFGTWAGLLGALLYLFDPWEAFWAGFVMKEPLAVPLFLLAVWLLSRLDDQRSLRFACAAGAAIGLATLARFPNGGLWVAAFFLLFGLGRLAGGWCWANARRALGLFLGLTAAMLVVLSPWLLRNWLVVGQPVLSAHFAGQYFYTGNGPGIEMEKDGYYSPGGIDGELLGKAYASGPAWQKEGYLFSWTLNYLVHHPSEALQRVLIKAVNMWQPTFGSSSLRNWLLLGLPYCAEMLLCLAGLMVAWRRRLPCSALLVPLLVFFVIHLIFWGEIRNRQYLTPLLFAFGGLALERLGQWKLASPTKTRVAAES